MLKPQLQLYDESTWDSLIWPDTANGRYAQQYLLPLIQSSAASYVANVRTRLCVLAVDDHILPVTVNDAEYDNSYVCSPYTHYISYAGEELALLGSKPLERVLSGGLAALGGLFKAVRFNRTVQINNWLLSTNLYPRSLNGEQMRAALHYASELFPGHAVIYRSLCTELHNEQLAVLKAAGCRLVPSRQIYFWTAQSLPSKARWLLKRDRALLGKHGYAVVPPGRLTEADVPRLLELYNLLYLDKYSYYNPQFTEAYLQLALEQGVLQIYALRSEHTGALDAVLGFYSRDGVMTTPLFGYDTALPQDKGLYRMLSALLLELAAERGDMLHESAGAAQFKRNRGAYADIEYSAVYDKHLPFSRRLGWMLLEPALNRIGVPLMRAYKF